MLTRPFYTNAFLKRDEETTNIRETKEKEQIKNVTQEERIMRQNESVKEAESWTELGNRLEDLNRLVRDTMERTKSIKREQRKCEQIESSIREQIKEEWQSDTQIKFAKEQTKNVVKEERIMRKDKSAKEAELRTDMEHSLENSHRLVRDTTKKLKSINRQQRRTEKIESSIREHIEGEWQFDTNSMRKQWNQQRKTIGGKKRKDTESMIPPKYTIKVLNPATPNQEWMMQLVAYLKEEEKHGRYDYAITQYMTGSDILRNLLRQYYTLLKVKWWRQEEALAFMTELNEVYLLPNTELVEIRKAIANELEKKYKDIPLVYGALKYFHSTIGDNAGKATFDARVWAVLHGEEKQMVSVAIDYYLHLFVVLISSRVDELRMMFIDDGAIWNAVVPNAVSQGELSRMEQMIAVLAKDLHLTVALQTQYQNVKGMKDLAVLLAESREVNSPECLLALQLVFDELRFSFTDLIILKLIRWWMDDHDGGIIGIAVDEIDRQTLETALMYFDNVKVDKWRGSELRMPPSRHGNVRSQGKWRFESAPSLISDKVTSNKPQGSHEKAKNTGKASAKKGRGKKK